MSSQPQDPTVRDRALAATAIANLADLPTDLIVAVLVAAAATLRCRGIGPLPIVMALTETVGPVESVQKRRPVGAALRELERGSHADNASSPRPGRGLGTFPATEPAAAGTEDRAREEGAGPVPFPEANGPVSTPNNQRGEE